MAATDGINRAVPDDEQQETTAVQQEDQMAVRTLVELMQAMMRQHEEQIKTMERKLEEQAKEFQEALKQPKKFFVGDKDEDADGKLKSLNTKDIKLPGEYTGKAEEFNEWYQRFQALLTSRHHSWKSLLDT